MSKEFDELIKVCSVGKLIAEGTRDDHFVKVFLVSPALILEAADERKSEFGSEVPNTATVLFDSETELPYQIVVGGVIFTKPGVQDIIGE